jgi:hypothetical protein
MLILIKLPRAAVVTPTSLLSRRRNKASPSSLIGLEVAGEIIRAIFSFPGGRRFHFSDANGNEFAVWSDIDA